MDPGGAWLSDGNKTAKVSTVPWKTCSFSDTTLQEEQKQELPRGERRKGKFSYRLQQNNGWGERETTRMPFAVIKVLKCISVQHST